MSLPKKIIISRTDSLGDVVLTLPMAGLLRQLLPNCEVLFLGRTYTKSIISCCPDVDQIIDFDELCSLSIRKQIEAIKNLKADCIIHVFPNGHIAKLAKIARIPLRIGTTNRLVHWITCNKLVRLSRKNSPLHESQLNLKLAIPLGAQKDYTMEQVRQYLQFTPQEVPSNIATLIDKHRFNLVLHPKSKGSGREWGVANFVRLIELLPPERFNIFVTGSEEEGRVVRSSLIEPYGGRVHDATGKMLLPQFISFLSKVNGIVAASTGPLHIAAALGICTVGLYPPIRPMHAGRWAPIGKKVKVFAVNKKCSECRVIQDCKCMKAIEPEQVAEYLMSKK
jgi:ADP-heptose:LPS heptosyltransferase